MTTCIPQLNFSFYRHQHIRADFSGGQITSDAGLLPLRAFDQRHYLTQHRAAADRGVGGRHRWRPRSRRRSDSGGTTMSRRGARCGEETGSSDFWAYSASS